MVRNVFSVDSGSLPLVVLRVVRSPVNVTAWRQEVRGDFVLESSLRARPHPRGLLSLSV